MAERAYVVGVGMTRFEKPGARDWDYPDMARESGTRALEDAGIRYDQVEQAYVGYVYGESTSGQRAVYELGLTGIPVVNVNNNCSTGSTALFLAAQAVRGGTADCVLALGFEKMQKGSLSASDDDREQPMMRHLLALAELHEFAMPAAPTPRPPTTRSRRTARVRWRHRCSRSSRSSTLCCPRCCRWFRWSWP
ncbi:MAG TPA: beta-ketoacyl synthase N-terminal-like domain-containing protein [Actinophytocola sp.]|jgi:acetyl-CoA acetyltransferase|nr:beta-ketoacyl synthase N-terminal-like domain-containing protein [Actinophytocola sp.]